MNFFSISTVMASAIAVLALFAAVRAFAVRGIVKRLRWFLAALLFACAAVALGMSLAVIRVFNVLSEKTPVAIVSLHAVSSDEFDLFYSQMDGPETASGQTFRLKGDQWSVSGGIIKWHPALTLLGLKSYQKPLRISGQYASLARQRANYPSVFALSDSADRLWEAVYRLGPFLHFIEAVYGSSAYAYADPQFTYQVYATPTGYMIKRNPLSH